MSHILTLSKREKLAWLAGIIDADGSLSLIKSRAKNTRGFTWTPVIQFGNTNEKLFKTFEATVKELFGRDCGYSYDKAGAFRFYIKSNSLRKFLPAITPFLVAKQNQALLLLEALSLIGRFKDSEGRWIPFLENDKRLTKIRQGIMRLNHWRRGHKGILYPQIPAITFEGAAK